MKNNIKTKDKLKDVKSKFIQIRVTEKQHQNIHDISKKLNKTISEIILEHFEKLK
jgi:hypothetical protein